MDAEDKFYEVKVKVEVTQAKKKLQRQKEVEHLQCQAFQKNASLDA